MKSMRALSVFAVLFLALLNLPAWGGGWESSGSPAASPVITPPAEYLAWTCRITVRHSSERDEFTYTEVLQPNDYKYGVARVKTPAWKSHEFLEGHELVFSGRNPVDQYDGSVSLRLTANLKRAGKTLATATVRGFSPMKKGYVSADVEVSDPRSRNSTSVHASCSPTTP